MPEPIPVDHTAGAARQRRGIIAAVAWVDWYLPVKQAHIGLVAASAALFVARGAGVLARAAWPMARWTRRTSVAIDTLLLAAGVALWAMLQLHPLRDAWLGAKFAWLALYVVLGSLALKRAPTPAWRAACFVLALAALATLVTVPLTRHPLGWLAGAGRLLGLGPPGGA
ncbi:MAG: SirB2 family protein [Rubrivivax sp.]|nr:SirB2 family protein [Rubrivivax sp.]